MLRTALDFAFRAGSYNDLTERLEALEQTAKDQEDGLQSKGETLPGSHDGQDDHDKTELFEALTKNRSTHKPPIH